MNRPEVPSVFAAVLTCALACTWSTSIAQDDSKKPSAANFSAEFSEHLENSEETFEQLKANAKKAEIDGTTYYFVEGDLRLDETELKHHARRLDAQYALYQEVTAGISAPSAAGAPLMLHVVNGQVMRWSPGATLKYCVLRQTFSQSEYDDVKQWMEGATKNWESTCNIHFEHVSARDVDAPTASPPTGITFTVRKVNDPSGPIASAFFPGDAAQERHLLVFPDFFTTSFDKTGVLRHELGHVLGFRHEMIRSEAPAVCQGEPMAGAIPATAYDPRSVMHYFCGGAGTRDLAISPFDRQGAQMIYGAPSTPGGFAAPFEFPVDKGDANLSARFNNVKP